MRNCRNLILVFLGLTLFSQCSFGLEDDPIVHLPGLGILRGKTIQTAWTHRDAHQFIDVHYAESPNGKNRFKPPVPVNSWDGIRDATKNGLGCPSILSMDDLAANSDSVDIEDCLSMTISTKNLTGKQPVMVYIHGEYLFEGNNLEASPEYILEKDIVLVVPQYRLGPFGFLSTMSNEIPGNAGVFDVILALHWIQTFISNFGGDPESVTLFGQVGGAAIAHLLTFSPVVPKNLFHKVIYHSGSALMPIFLASQPTKFTRDIAARAGCRAKHIESLNKCLKSIPAIDILRGFYKHAKLVHHFQQENIPEGVGSYGGVQFTIGGPSGVLPQNPSTMLHSSKNVSYPTMGGAPRNAGTRALKEIFEVDFSGAIPDEIYSGIDYINHITLQSVGLDDRRLMTAFLTKKIFTIDSIKNGTFMAMLPGLVDLASTLLHKSSVLYALQRNSKHLPEKTFLYSFDYKGQYNRYPDFDADFDVKTPFTAGVSLTDENIYLFPYPEHVQNLNVLDSEIAKKMVEMWTTFAKNGIPSVPDGLTWPHMENQNGPYLKINEPITIGQNYFDEFAATVRDENKGMSIIKKGF